MIEQTVCFSFCIGSILSKGEQHCADLKEAISNLTSSIISEGVDCKGSMISNFEDLKNHLKSVNVGVEKSLRDFEGKVTNWLEDTENKLRQSKNLLIQQQMQAIFFTT
jgi:hypothetical protein